MSREEQIKKVEDILRYSNIVWSKYGDESIHKLATKIVDGLAHENTQRTRFS